MSQSEEGALVFAVFGALFFGVPILYVAGMWVLSRIRDRQDEKESRIAARVKRGFPPHFRCVCGLCAEWRSKDANITGLQS